MKFVIKGRLVSLNEYINSERTNRYAAAKLKKEQQTLISWAIKQYNLKPVSNYPVKLKITWYEKNNKRDADNVVFAKKFLQDALVVAGILKDDSRKYIVGFEEEVLTDKQDPRIEIEIMEA